MAVCEPPVSCQSCHCMQACGPLAKFPEVVRRERDRKRGERAVGRAPSAGRLRGAVGQSRPAPHTRGAGTKQWRWTWTTRHGVPRPRRRHACVARGRPGSGCGESARARARVRGAGVAPVGLCGFGRGGTRAGEGPRSSAWGWPSSGGDARAEDGPAVPGLRGPGQGARARNRPRGPGHRTSLLSRCGRPTGAGHAAEAAAPRRRRQRRAGSPGQEVPPAPRARRAPRPECRACAGHWHEAEARLGVGFGNSTRARGTRPQSGGVRAPLAEFHAREAHGAVRGVGPGVGRNSTRARGTRFRPGGHCTGPAEIPRVRGARVRVGRATRGGSISGYEGGPRPESWW